MSRFVFVGVAFLIASDFTLAISTKVDFGEEQESASEDTDSPKENEDVEVQHTIVLSTKLKNNNGRAFQNSRDDYTHKTNFNSNHKVEDSGEVPVIKGYKAVETTRIFTPDTRQKLPANNFARQNTPDEYDFYPNMDINTMQFKPSNFYNNIHWRNLDDTRNLNNFIRRNDRSGNIQKFNFNRESDDGVRDFYCKKCRELSRRQGMRGCGLPSRSNLQYHEITTPKMKIDGKLAKLK